MSNRTDSAIATEGGVTKSALAQHLRERIVAGEFPPGSRLPPRSALEQHFGTTKVTVQRAFDDLTDDGFITVDGKRGTFVAQDPPHLTRYGLLFPGTPDEMRHHQFWDTLLAEVAKVTEAGPAKIHALYGVQGPHPEPRRQLAREIRSHQLAGVIYAYNPGTSDEAQLLAEFGVPRVAITHSNIPVAMPAVSTDYRSFYDRALDEVVRQGKQTVAVLMPEVPWSNWSRYFLDGAARRGLMTKPYWCLPMSLNTPEVARPVTHLLMNASQVERPEALIVADDNPVDAVLAGLQDAGIVLPRDLLVVAHSNFPVAPKPYHRLLNLVGYDVTQILGECLRLLSMQRNGELVPALTSIEAVTGPAGAEGLSAI